MMSRLKNCIFLILCLFWTLLWFSPIMGLNMSHDDLWVEKLYSICHHIHIQKLPISVTYFRNWQKARGSGSRPRREERHLSVSVSVSRALLHLLGGERSREGEGGGGGSSCRRAVTLILITKATGVQSHNPLLCPMGVGWGCDSCSAVPLQTCITHTHSHIQPHTKSTFHHFRGHWTHVHFLETFPISSLNLILNLNLTWP